jgi:ketosteroid isomerase-like protein
MSEANTIAQLREKHVNDFNASNADAMGEQMCEDTLTMPPHQSPLVGKAATVAWIREGFTAAKSHMDVSPQDLVVTDNIAYDLLAWTQTITLTDSGETSNDSGNCMWIWRKDDDGEWRLWRALWNSDQDAQNIWTGASR